MNHLKHILIVSAVALSATFSNAQNSSKDMNYHVDRFADIEVLRYDVPGFNALTLNQKILLYYLSQAASWGRDILFDQHGKYNLVLRQTLENIYTNYSGDKSDAQYKAFETYLKQVWFANGVHHHYSMDKFQPQFSKEFFETQLKALPKDKQTLFDGTTVSERQEILEKVIFDKDFMPKRVCQGEGFDLIKASANNFYEGVTQKEVEAYYNSLKTPNDSTPISYGLNSKVIKENGKLKEITYKVGGLYTEAIEKIVYWLKKAETVAENDTQKAIIDKLVKYYETGDLKTFDEYSILWVGETQSRIDFINGFIEVYGDPLGLKGAWESVVNFKNLEASRRTEIISANAQWFEDNSPTDKRFKKDNVTGVSAKVITVCALAGDSYPASPIGINLPNADWIRAQYGSKSVTIGNLTEAYDLAAKGDGFNEEFIPDKSIIELIDKYGFITDDMHTDLHECLGHGSGQLLPGVDPDAMKSYGSTLEEARADLFALYYLADPKMIELGLLDNADAYKAQYYEYMMNGSMTQLKRIELGKDVEEAHMRNRKLIAEWCIEHGKADNVIALIKKDGKTYLQINDYEKLRHLIGELLAEVQRIKSEGDYEACSKLIETYGVKVDQDLHKEVLERFSKLNLAPYKGFINPVFKTKSDSKGNITDVTLDFSEDYVHQMLRYSTECSPLTGHVK